MRPSVSACGARLARAPLPVFGATCALVLATLLPGPAHAEQARVLQGDPQQTERALELLQIQQGRTAKPAVNMPRIVRPEPQADTTPVVTLNRVSVEGASALGDAALAPAYQPYLGREVSQADLVAIAGAISAGYRNAGYHLSRAIIPPQDIKNGHLRIRVIEGRISEVVAKGDAADRFGAPSLFAPITAEPISRLRTLERQLMLVNHRPGIRVSDTTLEEIGEATGNFRLVVQLQTWSVYGAVALDNLGSKAIGPLQSFATVALNSILAPGDALTLDMATVPTTPRELTYGRLSYDVPLGTDGFRVGASAWQSSIRPGDERRWSDTRIDSAGFELRGSILPLVTQKSSLRLTAAASMSAFSERDAFGPNYTDHVRTVSIAADYTLDDAIGGQNFAAMRLRKGIGGSGAAQRGDALLSREGASSDFAAVDFALARYQKLSDAWSFKLAAAGQFASAPLLISQRFYLGGAAFGRGYDPGEISGDNAVAGSAELRFDQKVNFDFLKGYQLYAFIDSGAAWDFGSSGAGVLSLTSAGAGVRFNLGGDVQAGVAVAVPLSARTFTPEKYNPRVLFSVSNSFKACAQRVGLQCS